METIFGSHPVLEALTIGDSVLRVYYCNDNVNPRIQKILRTAKTKRIPVRSVSKENLAEMTGSAKTQGVAAMIEGHAYVALSDILERARHLQEPSLVALLDGIEDPHNLGAIIRSAEGAGVHGLVVPKRRSARITATVVKTSAGASSHLRVAQVSNLNYTIDELKKQDVWIMGADPEGDRNYTEADLTGPIGVVIGSEGYGLHDLVKKKCDFLLKIPMYGRVNSLNASVAAALLFFEIRRQRRLKM